MVRSYVAQGFNPAKADCHRTFLPAWRLIWSSPVKSCHLLCSNLGHYRSMHLVIVSSNRDFAFGRDKSLRYIVKGSKPGSLGFGPVAAEQTTGYRPP